MSEQPFKAHLASILSFDPSIRYVILVGGQGQPLARVDRLEASALEPPEQTTAVLQRFAIARGMTMGSDSFYGRMLTIVVRREKLVELLFPLENQMVLVGAESNFPLEKTVQLEESLARIHGSKSEEKN